MALTFTNSPLEQLAAFAIVFVCGVLACLAFIHKAVFARAADG